MRIVSLLPSTTEILFAIGAGEDVVGVTFECDFPVEARSRRIVSTSAMPEGLTPERLAAAQISPGGLAALGTPPRLGRLFLPAEERPDAVILDLGLPDQDGFSVLQHIRAGGLTPVVVLSARAPSKNAIMF